MSFKYKVGSTPNWKQRAIGNRSRVPDGIFQIVSSDTDEEGYFDSSDTAPSPTTPRHNSLPNQEDDGNTPLHLAIANGNSAEVKRLLVNKPSLVHSKNNEGRTPLHLAAANFSTPVSIIELVRAYGADVNATDNQNQTPLDLAILYNRNRQRIIRALKKYGARASAKPEHEQEIEELALKVQRFFHKTKKEAKNPENEPASQEEIKDAEKMLNILTIQALTSNGYSESIENSKNLLWQSSTKDKARDDTVNNLGILRATVSFKQNSDGSTNEELVRETLNKLTKTTIHSSILTANENEQTFEFSLKNPEAIKKLAASYKELCGPNSPIQEYLNKNPVITFKHSRQKTAEHILRQIKQHTSPRSLAIDLYQHYITLKNRSSSLCEAIEKILTKLLGIDGTPSLDKAKLIEQEMRKQYQYEFNLTSTKENDKQILELYKFIHYTESRFKYKALSGTEATTEMQKLVQFARMLIDKLNGNKRILNPPTDMKGYEGSIVEKIYDDIQKHNPHSSNKDEQKMLEIQSTIKQFST